MALPAGTMTPAAANTSSATPMPCRTEDSENVASAAPTSPASTAAIAVHPHGDGCELRTPLTMPTAMAPTTPTRNAAHTTITSPYPAHRITDSGRSHQRRQQAAANSIHASKITPPTPRCRPSRCGVASSVAGRGRKRISVDGGYIGW